MTESEARRTPPYIVVVADVQSNAQYLIERVLKPAGIRAGIELEEGDSPDILIVDITQLRGDPLSGLRNWRLHDDETPAIVLAAHFPANRLRDLFRLGVSDVLLKPFRPVDLVRALSELHEARSVEMSSQLLSRRLKSAHELARRRTEEIRMLSEIGRVVASLTDLDEILTRVVEAAAFVTGAEEANIYLVESGSNEVVLRASKQAGDRKGTLQRLRTTDTLAGQVYRTGEPVMRQPALEEEPVKVQTGFLVQSLIKAPIRVRAKVVGVLGVYNRLAQRSFTEHQLTLLMALADWAGVALRQAGFPEHDASPDAPAAAPASGGHVTFVPPELIEGLEEVIEAVESLLYRGQGQLSMAQRDELAAIHDRLRELAMLPVAMLRPQQARELVDLPGIIMRVSDDLRMAASQSGLELITEPGGSIPLFPGDPGSIHRVIEALTASAIRRTQRGRVVIEVLNFQVHGGASEDLPLPSSPHLEDGAWVAVRVADTSPGLSPDTVAALTSEEVDHTRGQQGRGLSMGEIRMIAESMGCALWYDQTPASTSITFAIPTE